MEYSEERVAERLRMYRAKVNLTQEQVSLRIGNDRQAVGRWESGINVPSVPSLYKLADVYGCTMDELAGRV